MKVISGKTWKSTVAKLLATLMVIMSVVVYAPVATQAASKPALNKTSVTVLLGKQFDLNVKNKVKGSTYTWTTSDKKIATVDKQGIVTGVRTGSAKITCTIKTSTKKYSLSSNVVVRRGATAVFITNKISTVYVGQSYDFNTKLAPSTSNDLVTWTSSDNSIVKLGKYGKFEAKKVGTVTLTATSLSGKKASVTFDVKNFDSDVTDQASLEMALGTAAPIITIRTDAATSFTIPEGNYTNKKLVVDAPNADVTNYGNFSSVEIIKIKSNTWYEKAVGNLLKVLAAKSRIVVDKNASAQIIVNEEGATLYIENNGVVEKVTVLKGAQVVFTGESDENIPVVVNAANVKITTSVPLVLNVTEKIVLVIQKGAEATKVTAASTDVIPTVKGDVTLKVTVGEGDTAKVVEVKGEVETTPTPTPSNPGSVVTPPTTKTTTYTLAQPYDQLKSITICYAGKTLNVSQTDIAELKRLKSTVSSQVEALVKWNDLTSYSFNNAGQVGTITGVKGQSTKTVSFTAGDLAGKTFTVSVDAFNKKISVSGASLTTTYTLTMNSETSATVVGATNTYTIVKNTDGSVNVKSTDGLEATFSVSADKKVLTVISTTEADVEITPVF